MRYSAVLYMFGGFFLTLPLYGCGSPKAIDARTIEAYKQAGSNNHGGYRSDFPDKWLGAWQFEWWADWRDPEKNLPGFIFSEAPKSKLPEVAVPFGLTLAYKDPTGASLKQIAHLKNLTLLDAREMNLTNAGLKELAPLTSLTKLAVGRESEDFAFKGAAGVKELTVLTNLTTLDLDYLNYQGAGLKELAALKHLTTLDVNGVDEDGLKELASLTNLTTLGLTACGWDSDAFLKEFAALKNLKKVRISFDSRMNKKVAEAGLEQLKKLMPDCEFHLAP